MSILFLTKGDRNTGSSRQRVWLLAGHLEQEYEYQCRVIFGSNPRGAWREFQKPYDIVFVHKSLFWWRVIILILIARWLQKKKLVYDLDDAQWLHSWAKTFLLIKSADLVFCGSHPILEWASRYNKNSILVPTVVDYEIYKNFTVDQRGRESITIGWVGSGRGHFIDKHFHLVRPALDELFGRGLKFRLVIIGGQKYQALKNYFKDASFKTTIVDELDWANPESVPKAINEYGFNVGLMPISNSDFNRAKCAFKAIEYMACGVPVVASDVGEARYFIKHGINGFLAKTDDDWYEILFKLMSDYNLRKKIGDAGQMIIKENYSFKSLIPRVEGELRSL